MIVVAIFIGWWLGNSDKLVLIQENEKIINDFNDQKIELDRKLTDIRLKLKEANLALNTQNIRNKDTDFGRDAKNILASNLAKGVPEKDMIDALRLLGYNKICSKFDYKELAVSTQSFIPPENTLLLLSIHGTEKADPMAPPPIIRIFFINKFNKNKLFINNK